MLKIFGDNKNTGLVGLSPFMGKDVFKTDVILAIRNALNDRMCKIYGTHYCSFRTIKKLFNGKRNHATLVHNIFMRVEISVDRYDKEFVLRFYVSKLAKFFDKVFLTDFWDESLAVERIAHKTVEDMRIETKA